MKNSVEPQRLSTRLNRGELLHLVPGTKAEARGTSGSAVTHPKESACEFQGLPAASLKAILAAVDAKSDVEDITQGLRSRELPASLIRMVLEELCGTTIGIVPKAKTGPVRNVVVVDDFLDDADLRRQEALRQKYRPVDWFLFPGNFSERAPDNVARLMKRMEALTGEKLLWRPGPIHGHYRMAMKTNKRRAGDNVHTDPFTWNAVLCLSRNRDCVGGVSFYRHKRTGLLGRDPASARDFDGTPGEFQEYLHNLVAKDGPDRSKWEEISRIDVRFNRLLLLNPRYFHNVNALFGTEPETARLTQGFSCYVPDDPFRFEVWA